MFVEKPVTKWSIERRALVKGIGINDAPYITSPKLNGKQVRCKYYRRLF